MVVCTGQDQLTIITTTLTTHPLGDHSANHSSALPANSTNHSTALNQMAYNMADDSLVKIHRMISYPDPNIPAIHPGTVFHKIIREVGKKIPKKDMDNPSFL